MKRDLVRLGSRIIKGNGEGEESEMEGSGRGVTERGREQK